MTKEKRLEQELGLLKILIGIFLAADFSAIAWLGQNHSKADAVTIWGVCGAIVVLTVSLVILGRWVYKLLDQLEKS